MPKKIAILIIFVLKFLFNLGVVQQNIAQYHFKSISHQIKFRTVFQVV